jgi:thiamine biosynthesis lipoprotein
MELELRAGSTVRWRKKGWIDLGGIAKGYAVDLAINSLQSRNVVRGLVNAGGDLRGYGRPWPVHLRAPELPTALFEVGTLRDGAIATSAGYFIDRPARSPPIDPLVDPASGRCVPWNASVSVAADACMIADALTKVVRLAPPPLLTELLGHYDAQAVVADEFGLRSCGRPRLLRAATATAVLSDWKAARCG